VYPWRESFIPTSVDTCVPFQRSPIQSDLERSPAEGRINNNRDRRMKQRRMGCPSQCRTIIDHKRHIICDKAVPFIPGGNREVHCSPHEKRLQLPRDHVLILPVIVMVESSVTDENYLKNTTEFPRHRKGGVGDHLPLESSQVAASC